VNSVAATVGLPSSLEPERRWCPGETFGTTMVVVKEPVALAGTSGMPAASPFQAIWISSPAGKPVPWTTTDRPAGPFWGETVMPALLFAVGFTLLAGSICESASAQTRTRPPTAVDCDGRRRAAACDRVTSGVSGSRGLRGASATRPDTGVGRGTVMGVVAPRQPG
jgi:hypothetical protein